MDSIDKALDACDILIDFCSFQCIGCPAHKACLELWAGNYESLFDFMDNMRDELLKNV